VILEARK
jgi:hypothetical protein